MMCSLSGHVAVVTGSTAGLGKSCAFALGRARARVVVNYVNDAERAQRAFAELRDAEMEGVLVRADVTTQDGVDFLFSEAAAKLGEIDIVVANATCRQCTGPIEEYDWDSYQRMIDFFIKSPFLLAKRGLRHMKQKKWGRIINIVSDVFHRGTPQYSAYVAAKGGQIGWSRCMARELAPFGVTVNMVCPGWIPGERHAKETQRARGEYLATIPAGRWGEPHDVADAVLYFASEQAGFVTGQTLCVNGGLSPW